VSTTVSMQFVQQQFRLSYLRQIDITSILCMMLTFFFLGQIIMVTDMPSSIALQHPYSKISIFTIYTVRNQITFAFFLKTFVLSCLFLLPHVRRERKFRAKIRLMLHVQFWENAVKVCTLYVTFFCKYWAYLCNIYTVAFGSTPRL